MSEISSPKTYSGAMTALVTPFGKSGEVDRGIFGKFLKYQVESGISGVIIGGTTGESASLDRNELMDLVDIANNEVGDRILVIAGCGSNNTSRAIELTRNSAEMGAAAGLSVVPYYNKPSQEGLFEHFTAIAGEGGLPIILYNVPGRTGTNLSPDTVARLAQNPKIVGIKEASGNLRQIEEIISRCPPDFSVLSGDDGLTYAIMALGGRGVISVTSNILPAQVAGMIDAMLRSDWKESMEKYRYLSPLNTALFMDTNPVPVKEALEILGLETGKPRLPLVPLSTDKRRKLEEVLRKYEDDFKRSWSAAEDTGGHG
jgi:4-hydroxy-tetrahydrodipicolinate synthase